MTNKQVIINNIDMSECEHLTETRHCKVHMAVMGQMQTDVNVSRTAITNNLYEKSKSIKKLWLAMFNLIYKELKNVRS